MWFQPLMADDSRRKSQGGAGTEELRALTSAFGSFDPKSVPPKPYPTYFERQR
jgi:hypothetical protein